MRLLRFSACWVMLLTLFPGEVPGNPYPVMVQRLSSASYTIWSANAEQQVALAHSLRGGVQGASSGGSKALAAARQKAQQEYLANLVRAMQPSAKVAHIPQEHAVPVQENRKWTKYYALARDSLRPRVEYKWSSNASKRTDVITLPDDHVQVWRANFDVVMWYRDELDRVTADEQHAGGAEFKLFLDYVVADLLKDLPPSPEVDMRSATVSTPLWDLDERRLREQLVFAYRYLLAKYEIYPEYEQFGPADMELLCSLAKISMLAGMQLREEWFRDLAVDLQNIGRREKWKRPAYDALRILQADTTGERSPAAKGYHHDEPCIITIPPPKPKESPPTKQSPKRESVPKVEIIVRPAE